MYLILFKDVNVRLNRHDEHLDGSQMATTAVSTEKDPKAHAWHIHAVQISTLHKYANNLTIVNIWSLGK